MKHDKTIEKIMDDLQKNIADVIAKSFDSIDFGEVLSESVRKSQEKDLAEKKDLLKMVFAQKQILMLDETFRGVGKSILCLEHAKKNNGWLVRNTCFNHAEPNPRPGQFWLGSTRQISRGFDKDLLIIVDDISLSELQDLYLKGYKNISGFVRKY